MKPFIPRALLAIGLLWSVGPACLAQASPRIEIEMDATHIRSNRELPKLLYIIPWRDTELSADSSDRKIVIPDLFADYYDPILPREPSKKDAKNINKNSGDKTAKDR